MGTRHIYIGFSPALPLQCRFPILQSVLTLFLPAPFINNHRTAEERVNMLESSIHDLPQDILSSTGLDHRNIIAIMYTTEQTEGQAFSPVVLIGTPLPPPISLPGGECVPSPLVRGGHTRLLEREWGVPTRIRGQILLYSRHICNLCYTLSFFNRPAWGQILIESMDAGKVTFHLKSGFSTLKSGFSAAGVSQSLQIEDTVSHVGIFDPAL